MSHGSLDVSSDSVVILGLDVTAPDKTGKNVVTRQHFLCSGSEFLSGKPSPREITTRSVFSKENVPLFAKVSTANPANKVFLVLYPTKTYQTTSDLFSDIAPEDRSMMRKVRRRFKENMEYVTVPLAQAGIFEKISGYLADETERERFRKQQTAVPKEKPEGKSEDKPKDKSAGKSAGKGKPRSLTLRLFGLEAEFNYGVLLSFWPTLKSCFTRPNKQDYFYVVTKSLGLNMAIKITFAVTGVLSGGLLWWRALITTIWYQSQDVFFTTFGQTYMKFLGKMSRMARVGGFQFGELIFCYVQFCCFELLNRTILGPMGENPLAYTPAGMLLILKNNAQGMISGGATTPAVVRIRRSGVISHKTMMHIYQLCGLTFHFGTFASYGYQTVFTILTTGQLILSWGFFLIFSIFFKDPKFATAESEDTINRLNALVGRCCNVPEQGEVAPASLPAAAAV